MSKSEISFQSFYQTKVEARLAELDKKKWPALLATGYMRFSMVVFFIVFFSIFLGFVNMFAMEGTFVWIVRCFMILVAGLVLYGNIRKYVYQDLRNFFPMFSENRANINVITIVSIILMMTGATYLGEYYLGNEFGMGFIGRYAGAIGFLIAIAIPNIFLPSITSGFASKYKQILVPELTNYLGFNCTYDVNARIGQEDFKQCGIYRPERISRYKGYDLIEGSIGKTSFKFSQLEVIEKKTTQTSKGRRTENVEVFKGLFYMSDFNKKLEGHTLILPDLARELFGENIGESLNKLGTLTYQGVKLEKLENREFEKFFTVYSSDPIEARYILSPKLTERIVELRKELDMDYSLSFKEDKMYLTLETPKDVYGPNLFSSVNNRERAEEINDFLARILGIPDKFDFNTRIWTT